MTLALAAPALVAVAMGAASSSGSGLRLDVKPGLWEMKRTTSTKLEGAVPQRDLSGLRPEQRARMEESLARLKSGTPHTTVTQTCVTQADLDKGLALDDPHGQAKDCERRYLDRTPKHVRFALSCTPKQGGMAMQGTFEVTVKSQALVAMNGDMKMQMPGRSSATHTDMTARLLGSSCGDLEPGASRTISR